MNAWHAGAVNTTAPVRPLIGSRWSAWVLSILLTIATALVFSQAVQCDFICFDDNLYVDQNPALKDGLSFSGLTWALTTNLTRFSPTSEYWQPLTLLSRLGDYDMFGFDPSGHHLTSVILHLITGLVLFGALRRLTGSQGRSAIVAALFLLHPMHVEPVLWVSARKDVVNALFSMLTLWIYGWYAARPNWRRYLAVFACVLAANMGKPMAVSLPFVLLLLDVWPLGRISLANGGVWPGIRKMVVEKIPLFALTIGAAILAYLVQKDIGTIAGSDSLPLWCRLANASLSVATYVLKAFVPVNLAVFYPHPGTDIPVAKAALAGLGIAVISAIAWRQRVKRPWLLVGWAWFLIVLAPVAGIIQIGEHALADRYSYIAFVGIFAAVVWQAAEWIRSLAPAPTRTLAFALGAMPAIVIVWYSVLSFRQVTTWRDSESVFRHALSVTSGNYVAHYNLGAVLLEKGRTDEARVHLNEAGRIREPFLRLQLAAADEAEKRGDYAGAIPRLNRVLMLVPWNTELRHRLGNLLALNREPGKALFQFDEALRYRPDWIPPRISIAIVLIGEGQVRKAERILRGVLEKEPSNTDARTLLAEVSTKLKS